MKHTIKKLAALLLALVMVLALATVTTVGSELDSGPGTLTPATPDIGGSSSNSGSSDSSNSGSSDSSNSGSSDSSNSGDSDSVTVDTIQTSDKNYSYNGTDVSITGYIDQTTFGNDGIYLTSQYGDQAKIVITAKNNKTISSVVLTTGYSMANSTITATAGTVTPETVPSKANGGDTITISGINSGSVTISNTKPVTVQIKQIKVTFATGTDTPATGNSGSSDSSDSGNSGSSASGTDTPTPATPADPTPATPSKAMTVTSEIGTITRVTVDGKELSAADYTVFGSSVVLSDAFMRSLSNGSHTIHLYDGVTRATAVITVSGDTTSPKTADPGLALYAALAVSATLGLGYMGKKRKED